MIALSYRFPLSCSAIYRSIACLSLVIAAVFCVPQSHGGTQKPNVVIILADDMGYNDAGFNGGSDIPTPAMDSIAAAGVRFTAGYVTAPQCAPSRASLLTGKDHNEIQANTNLTMDLIGLPEGPTFADRLKQAGYRTGMVGKWHLGESDEKHPTRRGFDYFFGFRRGGNFYFPPKEQTSIPKMELGMERASITQYLTDELGDRAVEFIKQSAGAPFFLYLAFNAPHMPMQAPEEEIAKFAHLKSKGKWRPTFAAMVSIMDQNIGKVMEALRTAGVAENTLVVFMSDNGGATKHGADNQPLRGAKGDAYEGGIRVPFALSWPAAIPSGQIVDRAVVSIDLLPTALAAAGEQIPDDLQGINLLPALQKKEEIPSRTLQFLFTNAHNAPERWEWAVCDGDWKLTNSAGDGREITRGLYHLSQDIDESEDVSAENPEVAKRLQAAYDAWFQSLPVPFGNLDPAAIEEFYARKREWKTSKGGGDDAQE